MTGARRPPWSDALLALAFLLAGQLELRSNTGDGTSSGPLWLSSLVLAGVAAALVLRSVAPHSGLLVACGVLVVGSLASAHAFYFWTTLVPLAVLVFVSAAHDDSPLATWGWTLAVVAACSDMAHADDVRTPSNVVMAALVLGGTSAGARLVRRHILQRAQLREALLSLEAEQAAGERAAAASERLRVAEEIGQVVLEALEDLARRVARARVGLECAGLAVPEQLSAAERSSQEALADVRSGIAPVRPDGAPVPALCDLPALVAGYRAAGIEVRMWVDVPDATGPGVQLVLYRLVQEALTNALKHGDGGVADARITTDETSVVVEVRNGIARSGQRRLPIGGHGLIGMRERVAAFGGDLEAGPVGGEYVIRAVVPRLRPSVLRAGAPR
jgi:signal transduction histidine kinase